MAIVKIINGSIFMSSHVGEKDPAGVDRRYTVMTVLICGGIGSLKDLTRNWIRVDGKSEGTIIEREVS